MPAETFKHTVSMSVSSPSSKGVSASKDYTADSQHRYSVPLTASQEDQEVIAPIDISKLVSLYIVCDHDCTLETNVAGAPTAGAIDLKANVPYIWNADVAAYFTNKITGDVIKIFLTNVDAAAAVFTMEVLHDSTI